jgi:Cu(I)/Ag(I) efflux system membrane fusion protein/cobalt-zinc-cadmium efflux system membrane fusion protein
MNDLRPNRFRRARTALYVAVALAVGVAGGARWHDRVGGWFAGGHGAHDAAGQKKQLWTCSMHPQVLKEAPGNCPICQMKLEPLDVVKAGGSAMSAGTAATGERKVKYWWDPMMSPPYIADRPGKSPMGMDLVPVYEDDAQAKASGNAVTIDPVVVQNMGVRVAPVTRGPLRRDIRTVGYLDEAQPNVHDVNLRVSGWVERLHADTVGMALSKGAPLFDLYSPEVQVAAEELAAARKSFESLRENGDATARATARTLFDATRRKLEQWGLDAADVDRLAKLDAPPRTVTFRSPADGYLTRKMVVRGAAVKAGDAVLRIVDLSSLWLDAQVYAQDLSFVRLGQRVTASVEGAPGRTFEGEVIFVGPQIDPQTRTATVRVTLPNMELALRPGMYATAHIQAPVAADALLVPREAVIDTGKRQVAFVAAGPGRFEPRDVRLGADGDDGLVQVLGGLNERDAVVTSGQFLLDAESRMREAVQKHLDSRLLAKGGAAPAAPTTSPGGATAHVHATTATAPATRPVGPPAATDPVFAAYLKLQAALGATQQSDVPLDPAALVAAADAAARATTGHAVHLIKDVSAAAAALRGQPLAEQRKRFKPLSEAAIALAVVAPPSAAAADTLFVAFCPMAPGEGARWLQTTPEIANPYFATSMKQCGSIERTLVAPATRPAPATQTGKGVGSP